jgi:hypothetical protein
MCQDRVSLQPAMNLAGVGRLRQANPTQTVITLLLSSETQHEFPSDQSTGVHRVRGASRVPVPITLPIF